MRFAHYELKLNHMDFVLNAITPNTKAIIPVELAGIPYDYDRLYSIVEGKKAMFTPKTDLQKMLGRIAICCDAAHAFGASRKDKMVGAIADFSSFSFHSYNGVWIEECR